jgi:hypothetical protein
MNPLRPSSPSNRGNAAAQPANQQQQQPAASAGGAAQQPRIGAAPENGPPGRGAARRSVSFEETVRVSTYVPSELPTSRSAESLAPMGVEPERAPRRGRRPAPRVAREQGEPAAAPSALQLPAQFPLRNAQAPVQANDAAPTRPTRSASPPPDQRD